MTSGVLNGFAFNAGYFNEGEAGTPGGKPGVTGGLSLRDTYPLHLIIGNEDCTYLLDQGATFSSVDPGGYEAASFPVPRDMPLTLVGQNVRLDSALGVAWEGRVGEIQRSLGNRTIITCQGHGAKLKDIALSQVFVDRDLTRWTAPTVARQLQLLEDDRTQGDIKIGVAEGEVGQPGLITSFDGAWASPILPRAEAWYDAGAGNLIASIYYKLRFGSSTGGTDWTAVLEANETNGANPTSVGSENFGGTTAEKSGVWTPSQLYRFLSLYLEYILTPAGTQGQEYAAAWLLAVYGHHGLTKRGAEPGGFYPSDIVSWVLSQEPGLAVGICPAMTEYTIPHLVYYVPVPAEQIVKDAATFAGWHWGVWEPLSPLTGDQRPRLDFRPYPTAGTWTAAFSRADCNTLDLNEQLEKLYNKCVVIFTDTAGNEHEAVVESSNPYLAEAGIKERTLIISGGTMEEEAAKRLGEIALVLNELLARFAGKATIMNPIMNAQGAAMPAWMLKAGLDRVRITDLPGSNAFGTQNDIAVTRVETTITPEGYATSLELGTGANLMETVTARLQAAAVLAAQ